MAKSQQLQNHDQKKNNMNINDLEMSNKKLNPEGGHNLLKSSSIFKTSSNFNSKKEDANQNFMSNNVDGELSFKNDNDNPDDELKATSLISKPSQSFK